MTWLLHTEYDTKHPDPCEHSTDVGCLNIQTHYYDLFDSREQAKAYAITNWELIDDIWVDDEDVCAYYTESLDDAGRLATILLIHIFPVQYHH